MIEALITYFIIFLASFATLSVIRLVVNFFKALLSDPPKPFVLERSALIYYGISISYLITLLTYIVT